MSRGVELAKHAPKSKDELVSTVRSTLWLYKGRWRKIMHFWRQSELPLDGMEDLLNLPDAR